jgi:hypothetical protein
MKVGRRGEKSQTKEMGLYMQRLIREIIPLAYDRKPSIEHELRQLTRLAEKSP